MTERFGTQLQLVGDGAPSTGCDARPGGDESDDRQSPSATSEGGLSRLRTAQEVAELFRVPRSTVYELARERRIPYVKVGRRTLVDPVMLVEWIRAQTVLPRVRRNAGESR